MLDKQKFQPENSYKKPTLLKKIRYYYKMPFQHYKGNVLVQYHSAKNTIKYYNIALGRLRT